MGFERIVSVLQGVDSNYKTDLFTGTLDVLSSLTGATREQMYADFTPYRVIADHVRSAAFLIADGVVPGNAGTQLHHAHDHPPRGALRDEDRIT